MTNTPQFLRGGVQHEQKLLTISTRSFIARRATGKILAFWNRALNSVRENGEGSRTAICQGQLLSLHSRARTESASSRAGCASVLAQQVDGSSTCAKERKFSVGRVLTQGGSWQEDSI